MIPPERLQRCLALVLFILLAAPYLTRGFLRLAVAPDAAGDLLMRNKDQRYIYGGQNPYDVLARVEAEKQGLPAPKITRDDRPRPEIPPSEAGGMPPWAFVQLVPLVLPWFELARYWYALLNALFLCWVGYWAYTAARPYGVTASLLSCASVLSINAHSGTIAIGNLGTIVLSLLVLLLYYEGRERPIPTGLALAAAAIKPTLSGTFFTTLFVRGRIRALLVAAATLVVLSLVCWPMTHTDPLEMLQQMGRAGMSFMDRGYAPINVVMALGVPAAIATPLVAVTIALLHFAFAWRMRDRSLLMQFAIAGLAARMWTYHGRHDNMIMAFLLVALLLAAYRRPSPSAWCLFMIVGVSLWLPSRTADHLWYRLYQHGAWLAGMWWLLVNDTETVETLPESEKMLRTATPHEVPATSGNNEVPSPST